MRRKLILAVLTISVITAPGCAKKSKESYPANILKGPYIRAITQDSATIMWETDVPSKSILEYGESENLGSSAESASEEKELVPDFNEPSVLVTANINSVTITDLQPDTNYYYRVKSLKEPTDIYSFRTGPLPGGQFRFVVYGDNRGAVFGEQENHKKVVAAVEMIHPRPLLIINPGDLVFSGKIITTPGSEGTFKDEWQLFFDVIKPLATHIAYYPVFGNHDDDFSPEKTRVFSAFFPSWKSPEHSYYSFDIGSVHFIILNSEIDYSDGSPQYNWLVMDLNSAKANPDIKFIIANIHRPPYTISDMHKSDMGIRNTLCPLFEANGVDVVFNGHNHQYERSELINGVTYIVAGGGGAPLYDCKSTYEENINVICEKTLNYVVGDADCTGGCKIRFNAYRPDNSLIETFEINTRR